MAKLYFRYGPMNSGKSTRLLQDAFNYEERGQKVVIMKPTVDTKDVNVLSRLGVDRAVDIPVRTHDDIEEIYKTYHTKKHDRGDFSDTGKVVDCIFVDEAQFLIAEQINGLFNIVIKRNIPVICYGIRTDFQTNSFPGSLRLMEIAHSLDEMKTICRCGQKALFNARKHNGKYMSSGEQVAIDNGSVEYESMCGHCYLEKVGKL